MGGMWLFSLVLVLPLLIGVASTSKRVYGFLTGRGMSKNNALTVSVVGLIMLAGIMSSPIFLGALPVRLIAGAAYLYFLFVGGKTIVDFFTGTSKEEKASAPQEPAPRTEDGDDDGDCGCNHDGAEHGEGKDETDAPAAGGETDAPAPKAPKPPRRTPAEARAEIERRIAEGEANGDADADKK